MHPAFSVIFFTVSSGTGYGLLFLTSLAAVLGLVATTPYYGLISIGLSLALITFGLLSSTWHLGHPERAMGALTQWRSSWLSREGIVALLVYPPTLALAYFWFMQDGNSPCFVPLALLSAGLAAFTVYCTAMIYRSLATIHQWNNVWTVAGYLTLGLAGGSVFVSALAALFALEIKTLSIISLTALLLAGFVKNRYWHFIDTTQHSSTPESATGLGHLGKVQLLDSPHTEDNYLLTEMGYKVARKHAAKLRRYAQVFAFLIPIVFTIAALAIGGGLATALLVLSALSFLCGAGVERWLFFAEAKHTVTLYYGADKV